MFDFCLLQQHTEEIRESVRWHGAAPLEWHGRKSNGESGPGPGELRRDALAKGRKPFAAERDKQFRKLVGQPVARLKFSSKSTQWSCYQSGLSRAAARTFATISAFISRLSGTAKCSDANFSQSQSQLRNEQFRPVCSWLCFHLFWQLYSFLLVHSFIAFGNSHQYDVFRVILTSLLATLADTSW
jgi:hypothetical protein